MRTIVLARLGGSLAIASIAVLNEFFSAALALGSFGASCALVFGYPDVPFTRTRSVIAGHFISSLAGLSFLAVFGSHWWAMALAVATAVALMLFTHRVSTRSFKSDHRRFNSTDVGFLMVSFSFRRSGFGGRRPRLQ